jgi:hypothetical protein
VSAPAKRHVWTVLLGLCLAASASASRASVIIDISNSGYDDNVVATPASPLAVWDFVATVSGTVTLKVTDLKLGDLLSALSTSISLFDGSKLQLEGTGNAVFDIGPNQRFTTTIYAQASGSKGWAAYNLDLAYTPKISQVPVPLAGWLLLSGCGVLATRVRRKHTNAGRATA